MQTWTKTTKFEPDDVVSLHALAVVAVLFPCFILVCWIVGVNTPENTTLKDWFVLGASIFIVGVFAYITAKRSTRKHKRIHS